MPLPAVIHWTSLGIGDGFNAPVRMPGEAFEIGGGVIAAKIVQEKKRVELWHLVVAESPMQMNPGPLHRGLALPDLVDFSYFAHDSPLIVFAWNHKAV